MHEWGYGLTFFVINRLSYLIYHNLMYLNEMNKMYFPVDTILQIV